MKKPVLLALALALGASSLAYAQAYAQSVTVKPDDIIAARQAGYDLVASTFGGMKPVVEGGQDVKPLTDASKALASWGRAIPTLFPDGTQTGHNTKARPEVWSDRGGFEKAAANYTAAAEKLSQLAEANDKAGFATQYAALGQTCGACHRGYRAR